MTMTSIYNLEDTELLAEADALDNLLSPGNEYDGSDRYFLENRLTMIEAELEVREESNEAVGRVEELDACIRDLQVSDACRRRAYAV